NVRDTTTRSRANVTWPGEDGSFGLLSQDGDGPTVGRPRSVCISAVAECDQHLHGGDVKPANASRDSPTGPVLDQLECCGDEPQQTSRLQHIETLILDQPP